MWPTIATWVGNIVAAIEVVMGYLSGQTTDEKIAGLYEALYQIDHKIQDLHDYICPDYGTTPYTHERLGVIATWSQGAYNHAGDIAAQTVGPVSTLEIAQTQVESNASAIAEVESLCQSIFARVAPGEEPPPITTGADVARILGAIAFVARVLCEQRGFVMDSVSQTDLDAAVASIKGVDLRSVTDAVAAITDPTTGAIRQVNDNVNAAELSINNNVDAAEAALLAAMPEPAGSLYPGVERISLGAPVVCTGPTLIAGPMAGVLVTVNSIVAGQSSQTAVGLNRYKGLGWVAFKCDAGRFEGKQSLENSLSILVPHSVAEPTACAVYCKPGSSVTVTPYTLSPA